MSKKLLMLLFACISTLFAIAQDSSVAMADTMRKEGKIYVVVAVILTIFAGIILYLVRIDRKITKLEKDSF